MKLLFLILAAPGLAFAKPTIKDVNKVLAQYREAKAIKAKVKKTVVQETMQTTMNSQGNFYFSKGKMRLEMSEPERTVLVYDGKNIWFESRADEEHVVVTKMKALELRKSDSLLASLFDKKDVLKNFDLKKATSDESKKNFSFVAKDKKKSDVQTLDITLKDKDIQRISYLDQTDNRVTLEFSDLTKGSVPAAKFEYKPPKGAEVTDFK